MSAPFSEADRLFSFADLRIGKEDVAEYDRGTNTATLAFDGSLFAQSENIDAFHLLGNGNFLLSTESAATLAGLVVVWYVPQPQSLRLFSPFLPLGVGFLIAGTLDHRIYLRLWREGALVGGENADAE